MTLSPCRLLAAALLLVTTVAMADDAGREVDAQRWLERMVEAVRSETYEGVFVYRYRGKLESMRILHRVHDGAEQERLYALSGSPREVIRKGAKVTCVLPEVRSVVVDRRRSRNPLADVVPMDVETLKRSYRFSVLGDGRVAGRDAVRIAIEPADEYRYGYRLWVDRESRLLLRADLVGSDGEAVEQLMFTDIQIRDSLPTEAFDQTVKGDGFTWYHHDEEARPASGESMWAITQLPPGFSLGAREWRGGGDAPAAEHHLYTDGLATVSVYVEPSNSANGFAGTSSMGAVSAFGRVVEGHQTVVVGEVPVQTVRMIGRGIERRGAQ